MWSEDPWPWSTVGRKIDCALPSRGGCGRWTGGVACARDMMRGWFNLHTLQFDTNKIHATHLSTQLQELAGAWVLGRNVLRGMRRACDLIVV
jgi:hypothetical protein